jgi:hypothetical protein
MLPMGSFGKEAVLMDTSKHPSSINFATHLGVVL